jgi:hypothetical protein
MVKEQKRELRFVMKKTNVSISSFDQYKVVIDSLNRMGIQFVYHNSSLHPDEYYSYSICLMFKIIFHLIHCLTSYQSSCFLLNHTF